MVNSPREPMSGAAFAPAEATPPNGVYAVLARSLSSWVDHRAGSQGAALAFYTLFSMTPILILAIAGARDPSSGLVATLLAGVLLLVGATSVFVELKGSLDELWGIEPPW